MKTKLRNLSDQINEWTLLDGTRIPVKTPKQRYSLAVILKILGVAFIIFCWVPWYFASASFENTALQVLGPGFIGFGFICFTYAKRMTATPVQEILAKNPLPPILYLRSFADESDIDKMKMYGIVNTTYERMITGAFEGHGPMVAIGKPGEILPLLGAARMYVRDEHWKAVVTDLITRAGAAVILRVGVTPGLQWELEEAINRLNPQQLILFIPFTFNFKQSRENQYEMFRQWAQKTLPKPLPESIGKSCLIYFKDHWEACALSPGSEEKTLQNLDHPLGDALAKIAADEDFHSRF